ncbi:helix-turn-helix domain-containing protein, partial [Desulfobacterota bacterium AH_259_B03_O07]|nr:helix-turn-helix domain-containing protein [Desulfobacterota bacterium AH_259_B03_O07]
IEDKLAFSLPEMAQATGLSLAYLYRLSSEGKLPVSKVGGRVLILRSKLEAWLKSKIRNNLK